MSSALHFPKHFYLVGDGGLSHQHKASPESMGSKAYNLLRMAEIGLPVPSALVLGTHYTKSPDECLSPLFAAGLPALEKATGQIFGDERNPLIVSVRSGAPVSMPGMMETLLNIGLCDKTIPGLLRQTGNPRLVWDAYRRLIASYGEIVDGLPSALFEDEIARASQGRDERLLDFSELRDLTRRFLAIYQQNVGHAFAQDARDQLTGAVRAVFTSWHANKAQEYRRMNHIDESMGTAVAIQRMVFGNCGGHSGAGVGFTRDPMTGEPRLWVDFLANAQGEDVVSGRRNAHGHDALASLVPQAWLKLQEAAQLIEHEFGDMQDFEFTVQDGALYMLQTREGKRTLQARARIALDLLDEGIIDAATALERTRGLRDDDLGTWRLAASGLPGATAAPAAKAQPAGPGVASGEIALDRQRAAERVAAGARVVLVRQDAETDDIAGMEAAVGLLTQHGARTSHAAVVARQLGKVCLVGCDTLRIDMAGRTVRLGELALGEGDVITLDGNDGAVYPGEVCAVLVADEALLQRLRALRSQPGSDRQRKHGT
jgi:pyruvate,orthophosphate dikinase